MILQKARNFLGEFLFIYLNLQPFGHMLTSFSAYVVHASPTRINTEMKKAAFGRDVRKWIESKVAKHKYLRGGW
jgi:hypothetical protein